MTPANQHTGIERLSDELLRELVEAALMAYAETQPDDATRMARMIAPIREIERALSLRASAEQQDHVVDATEMVGAKPVAWRWKSGFADIYTWEVTADRSIADYARVQGCIVEPLFPHPHSSSAVDGVTVKPLEWRDDKHAPTDFGMFYRLIDSGGGAGCVLERHEGSFTTKSFHRSAVDAKNAAQMDFEARILSALHEAQNG